jgi:hypothetical protein
MQAFGFAREAVDGALGFDTAAHLSAAQAKAFAAAGFTWAARYISRGEESARDLQPAEVHALFDAGLALVVVQHVALSPWHPSEDLGRVLGDEARQDARTIGCPSGVALWLDLEGVAASCPTAEVVAFCNAWSAEVALGDYPAGVYVGANCGINGTDLYRKLSLKRYWRSMSRSSPIVDVRGFQIVQSFGSSLDGIEYDRDVIRRDALGDLPVWWAAE